MGVRAESTGKPGKYEKAEQEREAGREGHLHPQRHTHTHINTHRVHVRTHTCHKRTKELKERQ